MIGGHKKLMLFLAVFFCCGEEDLQLCFGFFYVTEEAGRKYGWDMPWPPMAECNMITNKRNSSNHATARALNATSRRVSASPKCIE